MIVGAVGAVGAVSLNSTDTVDSWLFVTAMSGCRSPSRNPAATAHGWSPAAKWLARRPSAALAEQDGDVVGEHVGGNDVDERVTVEVCGQDPEWERGRCVERGRTKRPGAVAQEDGHLVQRKASDGEVEDPVPVQVRGSHVRCGPARVEPGELCEPTGAIRERYPDAVLTRRDEIWEAVGVGITHDHRWAILGTRDARR